MLLLLLLQTSHHEVYIFQGRRKGGNVITDLINVIEGITLFPYFIGS